MLTTVQVQLAAGFGLFAILSIIRIQGGRVTAQEMGYYFLALVLGLINGLGFQSHDFGLVVAMNVVLLLLVFAVDCKPLRDRVQHMDVKLDGVYTNQAALVAELERKLGGRVAYYEINEINLIAGHEGMVIDVRLRPAEGVIQPPPVKLPQEADGAAPAPGSKPAGHGDTGSSVADRRDDAVRQGGDRSVPGAGRVVRRPVVAVLALVLSVAMAGCAGGTRPTPSAPSSGVAAGTLVMVIRHGEKPDGSDPGVDAQGNKDNSSLTETGWERANRLVDLFDPVPGPPRPGLATPKAIYAAGANDAGEGLRPRETVMPLAARLGLTLDTSYGAGDEKKLVQQVITQPGPTLISWQHGEIPDIAKAFPSVTPKPPSDWPDDRFDIVWTFTRTADGWQFAQVPELVLPGDQDTDIEN